MQWTFANDGNTKDQIFLHVELGDVTLPARGDWLLWDLTDNSGTAAIGNSCGKRVTKTGEVNSTRVAGVVEQVPGQIGSTTVKTPVFLLQAWGFHDAAFITNGANNEVIAAELGLTMTATAGRVSGMTTAAATALDTGTICGFSYDNAIAANTASQATNVHVKCL